MGRRATRQSLRLEEGRHYTVVRVYTNDLGVIAFARLKHAQLVGCRGHVKVAAQLVVNILAVLIRRVAIRARAQTVRLLVHKVVLKC